MSVGRLPVGGRWVTGKWPVCGWWVTGGWPVGGCWVADGRQVGGRWVAGGWPVGGRWVTGEFSNIALILSSHDCLTKLNTKIQRHVKSIINLPDSQWHIHVDLGKLCLSVNVQTLGTNS